MVDFYTENLPNFNEKSVDKFAKFKYNINVKIGGN